jgi:hypothetical protein
MRLWRCCWLLMERTANGITVLNSVLGSVLGLVIGLCGGNHKNRRLWPCYGYIYFYVHLSCFYVHLPTCQMTKISMQRNATQGNAIKHCTWLLAAWLLGCVAAWLRGCLSAWLLVCVAACLYCAAAHWIELARH